MRKLQLTLVSFFLLISSYSLHALDGIPKSFTIGTTPMVLNGQGTRTKFIISVYNAGLFLKVKSKNPQQIIDANEPMAIRMKIVSGFASAEKMKQALLEGFNNSTNGNTAPIQAEIDQLLKAAFSGEVAKGDIFDLVYTPASGTQVLKNAKTMTVVRGIEIKKALFGIWLSDRPAQASLKSEMLGK
jgi:hypothetical protein